MGTYPLRALLDPDPAEEMSPLRDNYRQLIRRTIEIDFRFGHRHLPGSLSALPILIQIFDEMIPEDSFILSKGHACAALYAILEARGCNPDVSKVHPERDPANGIAITAGSLGHGLPIAVGLAFALKMHWAKFPFWTTNLPGASRPPRINVLMGDGECLEGTTWESLNLARRLELQEYLQVWVDYNGLQGSDSLLCPWVPHYMRDIFPSVYLYFGQPGAGVELFKRFPGESVHTVTQAEFDEMMEKDA